MDIEEKTTSGIKSNSERGRKLKEIRILILHEITMASKTVFKAVNKFLKDLLDSDEPIEEIVIILVGDFRQSLLIIWRGKRLKW